MKKMLLLLFMVSGAHVFAEELKTFEQIRTTVAKGKLVRIFIDYAKCSASEKDYEKKASYNGAYTPNEIAINNDAGYIAASLNHFTINDPQFPDQAIYEFNRYTIYHTGDVVITILPLNAVDYKPLASKITFTCKINETAKFYSQ